MNTDEPAYAETPGCAATRELIPELAAGVVSGEERARALAHLARCRSCRQELDEVSKVVDELLLLAPETEPPAGFEISVLSQLAAPRRGARTRWRVAAFQAAALVVVAGLATGGTLWETAEERRLGAYYQSVLAEANGRYLVIADLATASAPEVGHVFAYEGSPSWVLLTVEAASASGPYDVRLVTRDGDRVDLGQLTVRDGTATWGSEIGVRAGNVRVVTLVPADGPAGADSTMTARFGS